MMCEAGKLVFPVFASFLILTAFASVSAAKTIYVPDDYARIQWAVDSASIGDTIIVRDRTYYENVVVNKKLTIKSENGSAYCIVDGGSSTVFTLEADGIRIEGFSITGGSDGIYISSNNNIISNNTISSNNDCGICLTDSNNNIISNNLISSNNNHGIYSYFYESNNNSIFNNIISNNNLGIHLEGNNNIISNNIISSNNGCGISLGGDNNSISNNTISSNSYGIGLGGNNNSIFNNTISSNSYYGIGVGISLGGDNNSISKNNISSNDYGIYLRYSNNNSISNNEFMNDGLFVYDSYGNIVEDNKVNGKPLVYLENESDKFIDNAGQIILVKCKNITVMNSELTNTDVGIELWQSDNCLISNNNISNNIKGIDLYYSNNNSISKNNISSNNWYSISPLYESNDNIIYLNNFINNTYNTYSYDSTNIWNSTEPIIYTYRGSKFENYMGNYWDDYNGSDANGDGIGETPYSIDSDKDNYPLIERFENYFVPTPTPEQTFDTGRPENPYPSISGEFVGTIRTNTTIIATKLYTYACEGTGGHTEHALIWNETWCAEAKWEGYKEDWMNISFNRTVVLMPYETYNITIVTGSYPQIHHTPSLKTENGWINCTEFTDANGNKYEDWIPAIMLWS